MPADPTATIARIEDTAVPFEAAVFIRIATTILAGAAGVAAVAVPPGVLRMGLAVAGLFFLFKAVTLSRFPTIPLSRAIAYTLFWPGLDPRPFDMTPRPSPNPDSVVAFGAGKIAIGAALGLAAVRYAPDPLARAWLVLASVLLVFHLGLFDILTGLWRKAGFPVERICPEPWRSASLSEFWGRRWNLAFHAFAREHVYRPLAVRIGREGAAAATFLFSGLAHESVISFPAGGGYGLPTLYFALHGALVLLERRGILRGRRWLTLLAVLGPLPGLFHPEFISTVMIPWIG